ncbi:hypothetical protein GCK32_016023, partial [Trichostrongylus colubriformis]
VCLIVEIHTWLAVKIVARTCIELEIVWKKGSIAFARRIDASAHRSGKAVSKRERCIRTLSEAEKLFRKEERASARRVKRKSCSEKKLQRTTHID